MKVLALDIATKTGWAVDGRDVCPPRNGTFKVPGGNANLGMAGFRFQEWLYEMIGTHGVEFLAYEAPVMTSKGIQTNANTMRLLMGLAFVAEAMAHAHHIPATTVAVSTWRKHFLGHGRPPNPKKAAMDRCMQLGWPARNADAAEAAGLWAFAKATHDRTFRLEAATPLFGRQGAHNA